MTDMGTLVSKMDTARKNGIHFDYFLFDIRSVLDTFVSMTGKQLKETRQQLKLTQAAMAEKLGCKSISTYRNWEQDVSPVPSWVDDKIVPAETTLGGFSFDEMARLEKIAKARGDGSTGLSVALDFVRAGIKAALSIALLVCIGHQVFHPEKQVARRFGSRKRHETVCGVEVEGDV